MFEVLALVAALHAEPAIVAREAEVVAGDPIVVYSAKALSRRSRIEVVDRMPGRKR